jgi:RNA polymerase sigma-70 factor (ECF subfamily)
MAELEPQETDLLCLLRVYAGDIEALAELYDRHTPMLHAVCTVILSSGREADDVIHRTWLLVWSRTRLYDRREGPVANWLLMLARREALEIVRARPARPEAEVLVEGSREPAQAGQARSGDDSPERRTMGRLPALERQALETAFFGGYLYPRLAGHLEVDLRTAEALVRRGLETLQESAPEKVKA